MASYFNILLKTEITVIPSLLEKCVGKYYNNALCNGTTWMLLLWHFLHVTFDHVLNAVFRKMGYREYVRIRLKCSLWYLGFYTTSCIYCITTMHQNNVEFYEINNQPFENPNSSMSVVGFIVLATFYLHSAFWERLTYCHVVPASSYLCLFFLLSILYVFGFVRGTFKLTTLVSCVQISLELARIVMVFSKSGDFKGISGAIFTLSVFSLFINYFLMVPLLLAYPLLRELPKLHCTIIPIVFLCIWLILEISSSVLVKAVLHSFYKNHKSSCGKDIIECSLFPPRDDATYTFLNLRKEILEREEKSLSLQRPKNRSTLIQTLKCMVAIKRKLNEKRRASQVDDVDVGQNDVSLKDEIAEDVIPENNAHNNLVVPLKNTTPTKYKEE